MLDDVGHPVAHRLRHLLKPGLRLPLGASRGHVGFEQPAFETGVNYEIKTE